MQVPEQRNYLPEEYLALEIASDERHEYIDGQIFLMTDGTPNHNQIAVNLGSTLNFELKRKPYRVFITDQRLWITKRRNLISRLNSVSTIIGRYLRQSRV